MEKTSLLLLGLILTAWTTGFVSSQGVQGQHPQAGQPLLEDEEYYDEEPLPDEQSQAVPQQPATQAPPPPPPVARPVSSLFARPSQTPSRLTPIQRQPERQPERQLERQPERQLERERQPERERQSERERQPERERQTQPPPIEAAPTAPSRHHQPQAASTSSNAPVQNEFFDCPEKFGFFPHHISCDKYWKCEEGQSTLKLCGNGLIFDATDLKRESCNYPFAADCGDRTELEPPQSTEFCPRLYGIFADESDCRIFWSCWGGEAKKYECSPGLAFDESNRVCTWADKVDRCQKKEVAEGFSCPEGGAETAGTYDRHGHPEDCRKFFVCIDNTPRMYGCELGTVFNLETLMCDDPEHVPGCEDYYGELDIKTLKKAQLAGFGGAPDKKTAQKASAADSVDQV